MLTVCAWCSSTIIPEDAGDDPDAISHGICRACLEKVLHDRGMPLSQLLDSIDAPILVISQNAKVAKANTKASQLLKKEVTEEDDFLTGMVFECAYANSPGGCGTTTHCSGCTIRRAITETFQSGYPKVHLPVTLIQTSLEKDHRLRLTITTQKVGDVVLLRIDSMEIPGEA